MATEELVITLDPSLSPSATEKFADAISFSDRVQDVLLEVRKGDILQSHSGVYEDMVKSGRKLFVSQKNFHHALLDCYIAAYDQHRGIVVRPDDFWLLILQSLSIHVGQNAEQLRSRLVNHAEGKETVTVIRDEFILDQTEGNDWAGVLEEFIEQIDNRTNGKDTVEALEADFSTTTLTSKLAGKIAIMDVLKSFFDYHVLTRCGFPSVVMKGTVEDYEKLLSKTRHLLESFTMPEFGVRWGDVLLPVLEQFVAQRKQEGADEMFWNSMVKIQYASGRNCLTGWINKFFPFWHDSGEGGELVENEFCFKEPCPRSFYSGPEVLNMPRGLTCCEAIWTYYKIQYDLSFVAGHMCFEERPDGRFEPIIGWLISRAPQSRKTPFYPTNEQTEIGK